MDDSLKEASAASPKHFGRSDRGLDERPITIDQFAEYIASVGEGYFIPWAALELELGDEYKDLTHWLRHQTCAMGGPYPHDVETWLRIRNRKHGYPVGRDLERLRERALTLEDFDSRLISPNSGNEARYVPFESLRYVLGDEYRDLDEYMLCSACHPYGLYEHDVARWLRRRNRQKGYQNV